MSLKANFYAIDPSCHIHYCGHIPQLAKTSAFSLKNLLSPIATQHGFSFELQMFLLFLPRQHVETLKEAKMRDGNFSLRTRLQGKISGFHLIRAESTYMLDGGFSGFCLNNTDFYPLSPTLFIIKY